LRVLFDTNVLISAFLTVGLCSKLLLRANKGEFELWTCPFILNEFEEKLKTQFLFTRPEIEDAVMLLKEISSNVNPDRVITGVCRDADDDAVLTCAINAQVDYIITGDKDLLIIGEYEGIKMINPRVFELLFEG